MGALGENMAASEPIVREINGPEGWADQWQRCLAGDSTARAKWQISDGGVWLWEPTGVAAKRSRTEWSWLVRTSDELPHFRDLKIFVVEISVSGKANAAGISFGPYKDFLTPLDASSGKRRLQLEVDTTAGTWAFRIDGRLMTRCWWDSAVRGTDDIVDGLFTLKTRGAEQVLFEDLRVHALASSCRISVIMTCHRFQQRLRVSLRNWCHQNQPSGAFEILVVNPNSPDGTHELLAAVAHSFSHVRVRELTVPGEISKNKGKMINHAIRQSRGEWIWLTDADCLFPPNALETVLQYVCNRPRKLYYGQRRYLSSEQTDGLLAGRTDSLTDFSELATLADGRGHENAPWGYTQIAHRSLWDRMPYSEHVNCFAHSDDLFIRECRRQKIKIEQIAGIFCLHMHHPFAWHGTDIYL
jgi:Glycosyl transferase family 2